jgi:glycosyltransferase involved in cell wall biosynthesis
MRKKRILFHSDFALAKTGFGRVMKALLSYLYKTEKYELHEYCCGARQDSPELSLTPWTSHGSIPNDSKINLKNEQDQRSIAYGIALIDETIAKVKPDIYIGAQDIWGLDFSIEKPWFKKITSCIWTTLDSLPILPIAIKNAADIKNYWVWSNFAEKALHKLGFFHVKTVHGPIDSSFFYKLSKEEKKRLRIKNNLPEDSTIIGFVFRNQLRKSVPNLMEGYKIWKNKNPEIKNTYLLLHTSFSEGWNIKAQADQHQIDTKEILTTYICPACGEYEVKTFDDRLEKYLKESDGSLVLKNGEKVENDIVPEQKDCRFCGAKKVQHTTNVARGVSESQLNEIYNLMDVYVHPFTSGGQEIPIQEAKLTELVTLITNYSCGEECCEKDAGSLALDWAKYIEHGTEFIKASTLPSSIAEQLDNFFSLTQTEKEEMGKLARDWAIKNYSIQEVGKFFEKFIDESPLIDDSLFDQSLPSETDQPNQNPNAKIDSSLPSEEWVKSLYEKILDRPNIESTDEGFLYWMREIRNGAPKNQIEEYFRSVARNDILAKSKKLSIDSILEHNDKKRLLYVIPESLEDCFLSTSIISSLRKIYKETEWDIYVSSKPQFQDVFAGNKNITKWIPYVPEMDNQLLMEGAGKHKGWFDICFAPYISTQKQINYTHNGISKLLM